MKTINLVLLTIALSLLLSSCASYEGHYWGMHWVWWFIWLIIIFWIFALPYDIPGQRKKKDSALDILQKRLASGQINNEEYIEKKKILEGDSPEK